MRSIATVCYLDYPKFFAILIAVMMLTSVVSATPAGAQCPTEFVWEWSNPLPQGNQLNDVFAVGDLGTIIRRCEEPSVPVLIPEFYARAGEDGIEIRWEITAGENIRGFRLYRAEENCGVEILLNDGRLIEAEAHAYVDRMTTPGTSYRYRLAAVSEDGRETSSHPIEISAGVWKLELYPNHPNPFNPSTTISFTVPGYSHVTLGVYDVMDKLIRTLLDRNQSPARVQVEWDGLDANGERVGSGVYFARLYVEGRVLSRKMVLIK